jgi:hypothetical protein
MSKYLAHRMHLVYLDQCVVSRLIDRLRNKAWAEVRAGLFKAHLRRRLLSPNSLEHLIETAAMQDQDAMEADQILRRLSSGWCIANEARLLARQIFSAIKDVPVTRGHFLEKKSLNPLTREGALAALRQMKLEMDMHNRWLMQGVNEINALTRDGKRGNGGTRKFIIEQTLKGFAKRLREAILDAVEKRRFEILADRHRATLRDWASTIIYILAKEHSFRAVAFAQLYKRLVAEGVGFIPMLRIKAQLQGYHFSVRAQMEPRDQYDITRISCVLPYADILVTDGEKAHAIRELGLDGEFRTEIFSTREHERARLVQALQQLVD